MSNAVVVPCLGDASAVKKTVESVQQQHGVECKIYIVEAGPPVGLDLEQGRFDVFYTHIRFAGRGLPRIRNVALQLLEEDRLYFTEPGDVWTADHLAQMEDTPGGIVLARWRHGDKVAPKHDFLAVQHAQGPADSVVDGNLAVDRRLVLNTLGDHPFKEPATPWDEYRFVLDGIAHGIDIHTCLSDEPTVEKAAAPRAHWQRDDRMKFNSSDKRGNVKWRGQSSVVW